MQQHVRKWIFWASVPLLLPQALWVRRRTPRFAAPVGAESGRVGVTGTTRQPLRLIGLGDSIIAGVGACHADECLTAQFARELRIRRGVAVEWSNIGRIGATTTRVLHDLSGRLPDEPADLLLISVGVNDVTTLRRRSEWADEILALADKLAAHSPRAVSLFLGLPPMQHFPALPVPLRQSLGLRARLFDETLRAALAGHPTAQHVPLAVDPSADVFSADGFHPSPGAYTLIARALADQVAAAR
ncbi:MAG: SGNH/GDSL hydrolase family protein [Gammaproteobacteria bacterium]|nr:SGNH/GDSL hydrolase family protein [Gammaproteobacteria bacterium]